MESKCTGISNNNNNIINNNKEYKYNIVFWFCGGGIGAVCFFRQKFYLSSLPALSLAILTRDSFEAPYEEIKK